MKKIDLLFMALMSFILVACEGESSGDNPAVPEFSITSLAYVEQAEIPLKHACAALGGQDISPQYAWSNNPNSVAKFAIIMDDEVSPCGVAANACKHWGLFNIPAATTEVAENVLPSLIPGAVLGINYTGAAGYVGPCPPSTHIYKTTIYALDSAMPDILINSSFTRSEFEAAYQNNIMDSATISGTFTP